MIGRTCTSFNIRHHAFCSRAEHNRQRRCRSRFGSSSSSISSSSDAAKSAVVDRLLTSQLPDEIMIMNTMAPVSGWRLSIDGAVGQRIQAQPVSCTLLDDTQPQQTVNENLLRYVLMTS